MRRPTRLYLPLLAILSACGGSELTQGDDERALAQAAQGQAAAGEVRHEQLRVGALTFDALTAGPADGPVVILLHGFPQNHDVWAKQITALSAAGYRVVAPNQRGYSPGARPSAVAEYASPNLARDVLGIADAVGARRFHLVGHDWGASIAWGIANNSPERLLSLTAISVPHPLAFAQALSNPRSCQIQASSYFSRVVAPTAEDYYLSNDSAALRAVYADLPKPIVDGYVAFFDRPTFTGALNWYRANVGGAGRTPAVKSQREEATTPYANGLTTVPTLYVWSDGDTALCRDGAVLTKNYVTGPYQFEVLEGVTHWVPETAAERLNPLLLQHLAKFGAQP